jgi:hypothetical protein
MNKRIKELEKQCWSHYVNGVLIDGHLHFDVEKFAELIIEECVEQGKIIQSQSIVNGSEEYVAGREMGIEVFMNQIKQHFGVES